MLNSSGYQNRPYAPFRRPVPRIRRVEVTVQPAEEPVTLDEVKAWLGITDAASDALLTNMIIGARQNLEEYCRRAFIEQTIVMTIDQWPASSAPATEGFSQGSQTGIMGRDIELLKPALIAIVEVRFINTAAVSAVYNSNNYFADNSDLSQYGRLVLNEGASLPSNVRDVVSWEFEYTAGYGDATAVPYAIKQALLQLIAYLYTKRGDCADGDGINSRGAVLNPVEASGAAGILEPYRILRL